MTSGDDTSWNLYHNQLNWFAMHIANTMPGIHTFVQLNIKIFHKSHAFLTDSIQCNVAIMIFFSHEKFSNRRIEIVTVNN